MTNKLLYLKLVMSFLETRLIDLDNYKKDEISNMIVSILSLDYKMKNVILAYMDIKIHTIKNSPSDTKFSRKNTGFDMFFFLLQGGAKDLQEKILVDLGIDEEKSRDFVTRIRNGDF